MEHDEEKVQETEGYLESRKLTLLTLDLNVVCLIYSYKDLFKYILIRAKILTDTFVHSKIYICWKIYLLVNRYLLGICAFY